MAAAEGTDLRDIAGESDIEGISGLWCASLGFSNRRLIEATARQYEGHPCYHAFNGPSNEPVIGLSSRLSHLVLGKCEGSPAKEASDRARARLLRRHGTGGTPHRTDPGPRGLLRLRPRSDVTGGLPRRSRQMNRAFGADGGRAARSPARSCRGAGDRHTRSAWGISRSRRHPGRAAPSRLFDRRERRPDANRGRTPAPGGGADMPDPSTT